MQTILVALNAFELNTNTLEFACYIGRLTSSKITGIFLDNQETEKKLTIREGYDATYLEWVTDETDPSYQLKLELIEKNIEAFKDFCSNRDIQYDVHYGKVNQAKEIIRQSRFADIFITDAQTCINGKSVGSPTAFEKHILKAAECPVIIAPEKFTRIDEVIFCYDGSRSSIFSVKQFDLIFPELREKKITLLTVKDPALPDLPDIKMSKEWFTRHYANINFEFLHGNPNDELLRFLMLKKNAIIIMGAYGRSMLSRLFKRSAADKILSTTHTPIFISHP